MKTSISAYSPRRQDRLMAAEILFDDADVMASGKADLEKLGFKVEVLSERYDRLGGTPTVWTAAVINSGLSDDAFLNWMQGVGEVVDGYCELAGVYTKAFAAKLREPQ